MLDEFLEEGFVAELPDGQEKDLFDGGVGFGFHLFPDGIDGLSIVTCGERFGAFGPDGGVGIVDEVAYGSL